MQILRDYQERAVRDVFEKYLSKRSVLLVLPTGGGKTTVAADIIRREVESGGRVLFLAHRKELIDQASTRLGQFGIEHGVIMGNHPRRDLSAPVQVASVQTLVRRPQLNPAPTLIVVDEAHHDRARTYQRVKAPYPEARVLGLTATPWRTDGLGLGSSFDELVVAASPAELIEAGHLVPFTGYVYDRPSLKGVRKVAGDYDESQVAAIMSGSQVMGNIVEQYLAHAQGKRAVVFAVNVKHSTEIVERFKAAGVPAEHLDGTTDNRVREGILRRLADGETLVVSNVGVLTEGWDCPAAEVCILARPTMSLALFLQMPGRVLRPFPGKEIARIHDHAGNIFRHGLPDEARDYSLTADVQRLKRERDAEDAGEGGLKSCPKCFAICASATELCPECGHAFAKKQVKEQAGVAISIEKYRSKRAAEQAARDLRQQLQSKEQKGGPGHWRLQLAYLIRCVYDARREGRNRHWIETQFMSKFGEHPTDELRQAAHAEITAAASRRRVANA